MPWIGPESKSLRGAVLLFGGLRTAGVAIATFLRLAAFLAVFFLATGFFLATAFFFDAGFFLATFFFLTAFFFDAGFFFATFFFLTAFFFAGFLAARFLLARRLAADFLATAFLFATFFLADFFAAGFFRATAFFLDDFFADAVFFVTLRFFPAGFLRVDGLLLAAFFREALAGLRFLLAVFFAGIFDSCRSEKNAQLYIARQYMEARISRFFREQLSAGGRRLSASSSAGPNWPRSGNFSGSQLDLSSVRDNRFMFRIALHYAEFLGLGVTPADAT